MNKLLTIIVLLFTILTPQSAYALNQGKQHILNMHLKYNDPYITIKSIDKIIGYLPDYKNQPNSGYTARLFDQSGKELYKLIFTVPNQVVVDNFSKNGKSSTVNIKEADFSLTLPTFNQTAKLVISDPAQKILVQQDISQISNNSQSNGNTNILMKVLPWAVAIIVILFIIIFIRYKRSRNSP